VKSLQVFDSAEASEKPRQTLVEWDRQQAFHAYSDADVRLIIYSTAIIKVHIDLCADSCAGSCANLGH
jgi:hypothetical protein